MTASFTGAMVPFAYEVNMSNVTTGRLVHAQIKSNDWKYSVNHTRCGILIKRWDEGRFREATEIEFTEHPVDCMACIARGASPC